ncbi:hypothetical protein KAFR_0K00730 [Kazachstania africana CBS 2517]|uniref:DNA helicase n=1 Tax=Kazachstania africana (strain ATCC 22294 / BCRC 22015 / CBS 2517 / CECT 1963 / NBRC 1671 / NRRL Y-8276) TaxID=1071382 RepID=H2B1C8_KAZAF|nr:hypothetical protein KAFR_0K00730 [Kazachstania africana CBS 2517]CCF60428.1 hypothetical protein KAFR_0K00730 [Kazachstania africana CBS 2517]
MEDNSENEVQVPGTSSPVIPTTMSSSPLKPPETDSKVDAFRDKFTYRPSDHAITGVFTKKEPTSFDDQVLTLEKEFPDFSRTLIQAVFKSNSFNLEHARARLERIKSQRNIWSSTSPQRSSSNQSNSSKRLNSIQTTKITLNKPNESIYHRYSNVMKESKKAYDPKNLEAISLPNYLPMKQLKHELPKPTSKKRKLVRGDKITELDSKLLKLKAKKLMEKEDEDSYDENEDDKNETEDDISDDYEDEDQHANGVDIDTQILEFLNTADPLDISDLAETTFEKAKLIVSKRPFNNLVIFADMDFTTHSKEDEEEEKSQNKRKRSRGQKKEGERFLEKINQSIRGYNALDSLLKQCSSYGKLISSQMSRWGVQLNNQESNDVVSFMTVDQDDDDSENAVVDEFDETEVSNTPTPDPTSLVNKIKKTTIGDSDDEDFQEEEEEEELEDDEDDEDYDEDGSNKRISVPGKRGLRIQRKGLIKFFKGKPRLLSGEIELKDYQQTGINWLNLLYHNQMSCILADDMGLGKTCQVISFLAYLKQINESGPHLIVVPSSTLENWLREFKKFCPALRIEPYYGSQNERAELREMLEDSNNYDVIVTTYNLAAGNKYDVSFLKGLQFNVVVYDEGHMLKNSMSERFNKLMKIRGSFRLLLTGTPLQNNLKELMSLLEFIMPSLFESKKESLATVFKQRARTTDDNKDHNPLLVQEAIERAKTMMKPFILRRRKDQVLKHLPAKHLKIEKCEMKETQKEIYRREIQHVIDHKEGKETSSSKNLIMALRKASIHPLLFRHIYDDKVIDKMSTAILSEPQYSEDGNKQYIMEDMSYMTDFELHRLCQNFPRTLSKFQLSNDEWMQSGKVDTLITILDNIINKKKEKVLIFSLFTQVLDILEMVLSTLSYKFLRLDGSTQVNERQNIIDKFYEDQTIPIFILSTKAGGFGINLVCANNVVIFDQSFNPHDDRQAADRSHRVGQTKEVTITTLITKDSIEEKIHQLAKNKLALDLSVSEDDKKAEENLENKVSDMLEDLVFQEQQSK